ncbi:MAG: 5-(carboxyamino)imidazole ribonucleotide synthase [Trueperaceae bacterium]|nr:5-(carboxyamino)imidazole ribonucleotide synthase [Trueperaceae bacterium]
MKAAAVRGVDAPIVPGGTLGVLGTGQLGRMFAAAAVRMGYRVHVFGPDAERAPAAAHAQRVVSAGWDDEEALASFARGVDAVTLEFENVPTAALDLVARHAPVRPGPQALHVAQNRGREKAFLERLGVPVAAWSLVESADAAAEASARLGGPGLLKTAGFGYDGKGQAALDQPGDAGAAWRAIGGGPAVLEARIALELEFSVVAALDVRGRFVPFPPTANRHVNGILDLSSTPLALPPAVLQEATEATEAVLRGLELVGVACVEFFFGEGGRLTVNEVAPRPHNSGHWTIEGAAVSQFEQQVRAVAALPLGDPSPHGAAAMANLLGDAWTAGEPDWPAALSVEGATLHLYGKLEARPGRKMGHLTAVAATSADAERTVLTARAALAGRGRGPQRLR